MSSSNSFLMKLIGYLKAKPWLIAWIVISTVILAILALSGHIYMQGNGRVTIYELSCVIVAIVVFLIAWFVFKKDFIEEYLMGWLFGIQWEFLTEPYWTYLPNKFNLLVWKGKDIPLLALIGWGTIFTLTVQFSNWIGGKFFKLTPKQLLFNWRVLLCDAIAIQIIGSLAEWIFGILLHCWNYNLSFGIGKSPLGLGWEVHIGYMIVIFWYGTTFRVWKLKLEGQL